MSVQMSRSGTGVSQIIAFYLIILKNSFLFQTRLIVKNYSFCCALSTSEVCRYVSGTPCICICMHIYLCICMCVCVRTRDAACLITRLFRNTKAPRFVAKRANDECVRADIPS